MKLFIEYDLGDAEEASSMMQVAVTQYSYMTMAICNRRSLMLEMARPKKHDEHASRLQASSGQAIKHKGAPLRTR